MHRTLQRMQADDSLTTLLAAWRSGDVNARERLFTQVYPELQRMAARQLASHRRGLTLDTSALLHEACERLLKAPQPPQSAAHMRALAATMMRQIVVDHARRQLAAKRGGAQQQVTLSHVAEGGATFEITPEQVLAAEQSLQTLAALGPRFRQVVECRFFAGLSELETAEALGLSRSSVQREWRKAQAWLAVDCSQD